jgi:molybdopterin-synthase adenylyltransferase
MRAPAVLGLSSLVSNSSRYLRQEILPGIGPEGQAALARAHVVIVGCGALGCASADLLARAGVGRITLIDRDVVDWSNLQRQVLFDEGDAGARPPMPKAVAARRRLLAVNSSIRVDAQVVDFSYVNAETLLTDGKKSPPPTVIVDGTDNFETRYVLNDLAVKLGVPYCYGGAVGTSGMQTTFVPGADGTGACLRCVFDEAPAAGTTATCDTAGVLGSAIGIVAACQAADAIKIMTGNGAMLSRSLLSFDLWTNERRRIDLSNAKRADCVCCGLRRFEHLRGEHTREAAKLCGQDAVQIAATDAEVTLDLAGLAARLAGAGAGVGDVKSSEHVVSAVLKGEEGEPQIAVFRDGRAIVYGTRSLERARGLYARYVGA